MKRLAKEKQQTINHDVPDKSKTLDLIEGIPGSDKQLVYEVFVKLLGAKTIKRKKHMPLIV